MNIRNLVINEVTQAVSEAVENGLLNLEQMPDMGIERPRDKSHGDWATTLPLRISKQVGKNPRDIAQIISDGLQDSDIIESVEIAGPGFVNLRLKNAVYQNLLTVVYDQKLNFGRGIINDGPVKINLEYVSANPTGPMHVGHGRWAALGDSTARVLRHAGYDVYEEFYINDAGVQMDLFGESVVCRYMQLLGHDFPMIENGYNGSYIAEIAQSIIDDEGSKYENFDIQERMLIFREISYKAMLDLMNKTLTGFNTNFDLWFSERSLYDKGEDGLSAVDRSLAAMDDKGYVYKKDGATWFKSSDLGDEKDRVLQKSDGEYTYFMSDVAYHYDKLQRGFHHLIDIWGADHHGYIKRCEAMLAAWGYPGKLEVMLGQLVNLFRDGEVVRMSKRSGEMVTFAELIDEVGVDATRYLMLSKSPDQPIDFDIEVAKKKDSSNPVYYVQYAHARICSILRRSAGDLLAEKSLSGDISHDELFESICGETPDLSILNHPSEMAIMKKIDEFEELVAGAARDRASYRITHYLQDLAGLFHQFYGNCHIMNEEDNLKLARLYLVNDCRIIFQLALSLLGVSAPNKM